MSRRKPLVPGTQDGLDQLKARLQNVSTPEDAKFKVAEQLNIPLKHGYNGSMTAHDAGRIGGQLGGSMVKEMIRAAQAQMTKNNQLS